MTDDEKLFHVNKSLAIAKIAVDSNMAALRVMKTLKGPALEDAIDQIVCMSRFNIELISQQTFGTSNDKACFIGERGDKCNNGAMVNIGDKDGDV